MSALGNKLRAQAGGQIAFWCPGCKDWHSIKIKTDGEGWVWTGGEDRPTFTPSVLTTSGHFVSRHQQGDPCWCTWNAEHPERPSRFGCQRCHMIVTDGQIRFLDDCSHALRNQTVPMPDCPADKE